MTVFSTQRRVNKSYLRRLAYHAVDTVLKTWRPGDNFEVVLKPAGSVDGHPKVATMQFQTGAWITTGKR